MIKRIMKKKKFIFKKSNSENREGEKREIGKFV